jgi:hypothetical protein
VVDVARIGIAILVATMILPSTACTINKTNTGQTLVVPTTVNAPKPVVPPPPPRPKRPASKSISQIVEGIVRTRSKNLGADLGAPEWQTLSSTICSNLASGGQGLFLSHAAAAMSVEDQWKLADLYLEGAVEGTCTSAKKPPAPAGKHYASDVGLSVSYGLRADLLANNIEYEQLLAKHIDDLLAYGRRYDVDVSGLVATLPGSAGVSSGLGGAGSDVVCSDGWVSSSGGKQGACSHHGGVP